MLIVGFLEGIGSERGIAARCGDSLTIRRFLGCRLTEETPDHSSFTVFRQRLTQEVFEAVHVVILQGLKAHGVNPDDAAAVVPFDRKRKGRKTANKDWYNPGDPDEKIGRTRDGACDMVHKPGHIADLESGAIISAEVHPGDAGDARNLCGRVLAAVERIETLHSPAHRRATHRP